MCGYCVLSRALTPWGTRARVLRKRGQGCGSGAHDSGRTLPPLHAGALIDSDRGLAGRSHSSEMAGNMFRPCTVPQDVKLPLNQVGVINTTGFNHVPQA